MESLAPSDDRMSELLGDEPWLGDLTAMNPNVVRGLAGFVDVATREGALPANLKLLYMATAAAAGGHRQLSTTLLAKAFATGLAIEQAAGAAAALVLSRGIPATATFVSAIREVSGPTSHQQVEPRSVTAEDALDYVAGIYGAVPPRVQLMMDELPGALEAFHTLRSSATRGAGLTPKHTELLLVSLNSALHEPAFAESHARDARDEGASETELAEAVAAAVPLGGMAAWSAGASAIEASRAKGSRRGSA